MFAAHILASVYLCLRLPQARELLAAMRQRHEMEMVTMERMQQTARSIVREVTDGILLEMKAAEVKRKQEGQVRDETLLRRFRGDVEIMIRETQEGSKRQRIEASSVHPALSIASTAATLSPPQHSSSSTREPLLQPAATVPFADQGPAWSSL